MSFQEHLQALERRRRESMVNADVPALKALFSDELLWIHGTGRADNKHGVLHAIETGHTKYRSIECSDESLRCYGDVALLSGIALMKAEIAGEPRTLENRFTIVWRQTTPGEWQVVNWQSTSLRKP